MTAKLIHSSDIFQLAAAVNEARVAGGIPNGGLLFWKGQYFQLVVDGTSTIPYSIVARQNDTTFAADAQPLSVAGAFALGAPLQVDGYFVQAFGDQAGAGGGGGSSLPDGTVEGQTIQWDDTGAEWLPGVVPADAAIYGQNDALGADLPTINVSSTSGFVQGIVVIDATDQATAGFYVVDGSTPLMQVTTSSTGEVTVLGSGGSLTLPLLASILNGPAGMGRVEVNGTGVILVHKGDTNQAFSTSGTDLSTGALSIKRPFIAATNTGVIDLTASAAALTYATSGVTANTTTVQISAQGNNYQFSANSLRPLSDNAKQLGESGNRWSVVFAGTGTINTSDAANKTAPLAITDALLDAVGDVDLVSFKMLDAVAEKGDEARIHIGVIAQQVETAFAAHGLDPFAYGLLCRDKLEDGSWRYGIRYEELLVLEAARVRRQLAQLSS